MHTLAVQLAPILGAEKSKVPFYVAGGLLVGWALLLALGIGMRRREFPANVTQQRVVMAITAVLVLAAAATAVITSGAETKTEAAGAPAQTATTPSAPAPPSTTESASTTYTVTTKSSPSAAPPSAGAKTSLKLAANPGGQLSYDTNKLNAPAGTVTITMANASPVEHDVTIAQGSKVLGATPTFTGGSKSVTLKLPPGTYTFYCSVPGHRQAGMEGTLTIS